MESLPIELVIQILSNTPYEELKQLCSVNKKMISICINNKNLIFTPYNNGIYNESLNKVLILLQKLKKYNVFELLYDLLVYVIVDNDFTIEDCAFIYGLNMIYQLINDRDLIVVFTRKIKDHKKYKTLLKEIYDLDDKFEMNLSYTSSDDTFHVFNFKRFKTRLLKYILKKDINTKKELYPEEAYIELDYDDYEMVLGRIQEYRSNLYGKSFYKKEKVYELKEFDKSIAKKYDESSDSDSDSDESDSGESDSDSDESSDSNSDDTS